MDEQTRVLVTGASGFIGRRLVQKFDELPTVKSFGAVRNKSCAMGERMMVVGDICKNTDWTDILKEINVVIHTAARVHIMRDENADPLAEFRKINVEGTLNLAAQAAALGVKRFLFISSAKVHGEETKSGCPYAAEDEPMPVDPYSISKCEAEAGLRKLAAQTGMEVVIIRPVLVYGPGVKANFHAMMKWLSAGMPSPLGAVENKRSLVALDNLVDLIVTCINHPAAANQTFLASDGEDLSTPELLRRMGKALGKPARLFSAPVWLLETGAALLGKKAYAQRLCGSLQVDIEKTRRILNWSPPVSVDDALRETAAAFLNER